VRFWDSSALVPVLVDEPWSASLREMADGDRIAVWWGTIVECSSALARRERREETAAPKAAVARRTLDGLAARWIETPPTAAVRRSASRLVRTHDLRAADAFQLAAAIAASDDDPGSLPIVTLDDRLALAASREGFPIVPTAGG
jgi:hypothetical protein